MENYPKLAGQASFIVNKNLVYYVIAVMVFVGQQMDKIV